MNVMVYSSSNNNHWEGTNCFSRERKGPGVFLITIGDLDGASHLVELAGKARPNYEFEVFE